MKEEEIVEKAFEKAEFWIPQKESLKNTYIKMLANTKAYFEHDFAIRLWGIEQVCKNCGTTSINILGCPLCNNNETAYKIHRWQWHLQQMILEEDPIEYLKKFL